MTLTIKTPGKTTIQNTRLNLTLLIISSALYGTIIWFAQTTFQALRRSEQDLPLNYWHKVDGSTTIAVLQALQGVLGLTSSAALIGSLNLLQWYLSARSCGLKYVAFLALSPSTDIFGTFRILFHRGITGLERLLVSLRILLQLLAWLAGLLLLLKTSEITVNDTIIIYDATAGVGLFEPSYVASYLEQLHSLVPEYPFQVLPYSASATAFNLVLNPLHSSGASAINCHDDISCNSYILTGGISLTTPWVPQFASSNDLIKLSNVPSIQLEFDSREEHYEFLEADCSKYGADNILIGMMLCIRHDDEYPSSLVAGLFICPSGTSSETCSLPHSSTLPSLTTSLSIYTLSTTLLASPQNYTITSLTASTTPPTPYPPINNDSNFLPAYRSSLSWLLNYTATATPAPSSQAQLFWSSISHLQGSDPISRVVITQTFHSILAFPLWYFQPNNFGNFKLDAEEMTPPNLLPDDEKFYTTAALVKPYRNKITINRGMFWGFVAGQGVVLSFVCGVLVWVILGAEKSREVRVSSFVLFDGANKVEGLEVEPVALDLEDGSICNNNSSSSKGLDDGGVLKAIKGRRVRGGSDR
ncbi:hypothetical protein QBC44DRAFT_390303 [Cladorrhinum sp. PSN332]|nr:hypothetical protein QBC44DRAFT_390303 [Cladorrhinum sp. PSN332]